MTSALDKRHRSLQKKQYEANPHPHQKDVLADGSFQDQ